MAVVPLLQGELVDPVEGRPRPAADVVWGLFAHVHRAMVDNGDKKAVGAGLTRVLSTGNGADRQRSVYEGTGSPSAVDSDAVDLTHA